MNLILKTIIICSFFLVVHTSARVDYGYDDLLDYVRDLTRRFQETMNLDHVDQTERRLQVIGGGAGGNDDMNDDDMDVICRAVEQSFQDTTAPVDCKCLGSVTGSFTISCDYNDVVCSSDATTANTCGIPKLAMTMMNSKLFSATTCISNYTRGTIPLADTCIFVDACSEGSGFCDCTASFNGQICAACDICENGRALSVNCSNVNLEAISTQCAPVDLDLDLSGGAGAIAGFAPSFSGFCSQIENTLNNTIECDCSDAVGGTFEIRCHTAKAMCTPNDHCGHVQSTVAIESGEVKAVTACSTYDTPMEGETCTKLQIQEGKLESCVAHYNGERCNSCTICDGANSVKLDCSNVYNEAILETCQFVSANSSYEFLPNYPISENHKAERVDQPKSSSIGFETGNKPGSSFGSKKRSSIKLPLIGLVLWLL